MPNQTTPQYPGHVVMTRRGETWDCPVSYVAKAKSQGWRPVDSNAPGLYDPADHTADQVTAHLATVTDDNERQRIVDAERAGKNRSTITTVTGD